MDFGDTYIMLFGFKFFEPMVFLINNFFFALCVFYFSRLNKINLPYAKQMGLFMLILGISSVFGTIAHTVHEQLGDVFFKIIFFCMNALSLFSIYFCFRAAYTYVNLGKEPSKFYIYLVKAWICILIVICGIHGSFLLIKIHAGITLLYALVAHYLVYKRKKDKGSALVVLGILISFLSIVAHSLKYSIDKWFNYKDLAHVIMIISSLIIYKGALTISRKLSQSVVENKTQNSI